MLNSKTPLIEFRSLYKSYGDRSILQDFNLIVFHGEFLTLLGPSGCGKTTLLRLLAGLETVDSGTILIQGQDITHLPAYQRKLNTVFQNYALFPHMTVFDNVAFGPRMKKDPPHLIKEKVQEALACVKLPDYANSYPNQLSGGQQQRVALARAIVNRPTALLLDESLAALDFNLRGQMQYELKMLQKTLGITFLFVTHDQEEALSMSDRIVVLNKGIIEQIGTPKEIYEQPLNHFVASFVGQSNFLKGQIKEILPNGKIKAEVENVSVTLSTKKIFNLEDHFCVLLRPEDLKIHSKAPEGEYFEGTILEKTYKGKTLDTLIRLSNNKQIMASEFFDEEDPEFDYKIGDKVFINWNLNWEILLEAIK